jgi:GAF domain-containing protein/HAMP domain-containing protein
MEPRPNQENQAKPLISPQRLATVRLLNDVIIVAASIYFLLPTLSESIARVILAAVIGMLAATIFGYFQIRRQRVTIGMGFIIYGLLINLTIIAAFVDRLGPFALVTMVLITTLSVSYGFPPRRVIEAVSASVIFGLGSLVFDQLYRGASFRLPLPVALSSILWFMTLAFSLVILYLLARQFPFFSLRTKLIAAMTVTTVAALAVAGFLNDRGIQQVLTEQTNQSLFNAATLTETSLRQFIDFNLQSIRTEASLPIFTQYLSAPPDERADLSADVTATLNTLASSQSDFLLSYALLDVAGNVLADTEWTAIGQNESMLSTFQMPIQEGKAVISPVEIDPYTGQPSIYFSSPVIGDGGSVVGVLRVRYHADILQSLIASNNDRGGEGSFAVLFDEYFIHLAHGIAPETIFTTVAPLDQALFDRLIAERRLPPAQSSTETFLDLPELEESLSVLQENADQVIFFEATDIATGNLTNRVVVLEMGEPAWLLAFFQPQEIYLAPVEQLTNNTILFTFLSAIGAVLAAIALAQMLAAPIMNLNESANLIAKGKLDTRVEIQTEDEIGTLGKTFNSMAYQLQNMVTNLESQVASRTRDLENRAAQLQAVAEVARDATSEQSVQELLNRAAMLIHDRFGYYHVGIYLKDQHGEFATLTASMDDQGQKLIQADHRHKIEPENLVGYTCILGETLTGSSQDQARPVDFHPLLSFSQAQMVLPLNIGKETIGAIDLHSTNPADFSGDENHIFQNLADQLAIAVQKAQVQDEMQTTLAELEAAYGAFTKGAWRRFIQARKQISGYRFNPNKKVESVAQPSDDVRQAWEQGQRISGRKSEPGKAGQEIATLAIPIKVRGSVISVLNIEFDGTNIPEDTTALIDELSERLSLILENARLIETAQRQVQREQLTSEITNTIRQSLDMDLVVRTAVEEIGEKLGLSEVELRLGAPTQSMMSGPPSKNGKQVRNNEDSK